MKKLKHINGGVTAPAGFTAAGVSAGLKHKPGALDLALVVSERPAAAAGTFTTNRVKAAPVKLCRQRLKTGTGRAFVINSGSANACTGERGMRDARETAEFAAKCLGVQEEDVFVCSTGTIGVPLPMEKVTAGIEKAAGQLSKKGGENSALAIMTTDTVDKQTAVQVEIDGVTVTVGGMAKGSGMIEPDMATMLAFLTTDAGVEPAVLQRCLSETVRVTFNRISVDGDRSTNDTVLALANGAAGNRTLDEKHPHLPVFAEALKSAAATLAEKMVRDGEGATKFVTVNIRGAVSDSDAEKAAKAIADSLLVKTSWYGGDPNWGRVAAAAGYSGAEMNEELIEIFYDDLRAVKNGTASGEVSEEQLAAVLAKDSFEVTVNLHLGGGECAVYTCDCSHEYVDINSKYRT
ncbi:MAG: bifunctional glutamate N-acetyltransferase/amino-acid acetyltransferase ArgJ [Kiritimatiellia bacterium]